MDICMPHAFLGDDDDDPDPDMSSASKRRRTGKSGKVKKLLTQITRYLYCISSMHFNTKNLQTHGQGQFLTSK